MRNWMAPMMKIIAERVQKTPTPWSEDLTCYSPELRAVLDGPALEETGCLEFHEQWLVAVGMTYATMFAQARIKLLQDKLERTQLALETTQALIADIY